MTYEELAQLVSAKAMEIVVEDDDFAIDVSEFTSALQKKVLRNALDGLEVQDISIGVDRIGRSVFKVTMG